MYWNIKCYLLNTSFKKFYLRAQSVVSTQIWRVVRIRFELFINPISAEMTFIYRASSKLSLEDFQKSAVADEEKYINKIGINKYHDLI